MDMDGDGTITAAEVATFMEMMDTCHDDDGNEIECEEVCYNEDGTEVDCDELGGDDDEEWRINGVLMEMYEGDDMEWDLDSVLEVYIN